MNYRVSYWQIIDGVWSSEEIIVSDDGHISIPVEGLDWDSITIREVAEEK